MNKRSHGSSFLLIRISVCLSSIKLPNLPQPSRHNHCNLCSKLCSFIFEILSHPELLISEINQACQKSSKYSPLRQLLLITCSLSCLISVEETQMEKLKSPFKYIGAGIIDYTSKILFNENSNYQTL